MDHIKQQVQSLEPELIALRRDFHQHPELGFAEFRTSGIVENYLRDLGLEVTKVAGTGVVALLKGSHPGKTVMLRADLDAIPQTEQVDVAFKSCNPGVMHGCGHDGHTAMLLVAARILTGYKDQIHGNVKFVFQPNEEEAGALDMIHEGVLEDPKVDAAFGIHLWTPIPSGRVGLAEGPVMGALEEFELVIKGKAGHTGSPHTAIDPIIAATTIVQNIQTLQTRETDPLSPIAIMVGKFHGGSGRNIIAESVEIGGTIRFLFKDEEREKKELLAKFQRMIRGLCEAMNAEYELRFIPSNPALQNAASLVGFIRQAAIETYGRDDIFDEHRNMAGEDFAEFSQRVPSLFYFIGNGNEAKGTTYPHHHPLFQLDEDTLKYGVEMHVRSALEYLAK